MPFKNIIKNTRTAAGYHKDFMNSENILLFLIIKVLKLAKMGKKVSFWQIFQTAKAFFFAENHILVWYYHI